MRTRFILCYDIRDAARLRKTAKVAEAWGNRLQYSVFVCDLSPTERAGLERDLRHVIDLRADRAFLIDIGSPGRVSERRVRWLTPAVRFPDAAVATVV